MRSKKAGLPLYFVVADPRPQLPRIWQGILHALKDKLESAEMDAYPNPEWEGFDELPVTAQEAQRRLAQRASRGPSTSRDPLMAMPLVVNEREDLELLKEFGPYSIACDDFRRWKLLLEEIVRVTGRG